MGAWGMRWSGLFIARPDASSGARPERCARPGLHALHDHRDALPDADAHRAQRIALLGLLELVAGSRDQACAAHAEWMAERDRAAVRVDARVVVLEAELAHD